MTGKRITAMVAHVEPDGNGRKPSGPSQFGLDRLQLQFPGPIIATDSRGDPGKTDLAAEPKFSTNASFVVAPLSCVLSRARPQDTASREKNAAA